MKTDKFEYTTIKETAELWGVTKRYVNLCIEDGLIPGIIKMGNMWLVPKGTQKPVPKASKLKKSTVSDIEEHEHVNAVAFMPFPRDNPYAVLDTSDERSRILPKMEFAYLCGDFELVKREFLQITGDDKLKLSAAVVAASASIGIGDYLFYSEIETWLKSVIEANISKETVTVAEWTLSVCYLSALAPNMVPDWLKNGDYADSPLSRIPEFVYARVKYYQCIGQYEAMLAAAQTALAFCSSNKEMSFITIYLSVARALACCALNRMDEAEVYLLEVMQSCLPHGFITPFVELAALLGGLLERCLERKYPKYYDVIIGQWPRSFKNWMSFHNQFAKDNITLMLSLRDYQIAQYAARGIPHIEIARKFNISPGTLKNRMKVIYETLLISGKKRRHELKKYVF